MREGESDQRARTLAESGEFLLEVAVLQVMRDAYKNDDKLLGVTEIGRRAGIYPGGKYKSDMRCAIVSGILWKLYYQGRVERDESQKKNKWMLRNKTV